MSDTTSKASSVYPKVMNLFMADQHRSKPSVDFGDFYGYINATGLQTIRVELPALLFAEQAAVLNARFTIQRTATGAHDEYHGKCNIGGKWVVVLKVFRVHRHPSKFPAPVPPVAKAAVAKMLNGSSPGLFEAYWIKDNEKRVLLLECHLASPVRKDPHLPQDKLYQIIYVSTASKFFNRTELLAFLQQARERNAQANITGVLLYKDGHLMEVMEGSEEAVKESFDHISQRSEHYGLMVINKAYIKQRQFTDWSMAFQDLNLPKEQKLPGYSEFLNTPLTGAELASHPSRCEKLLLLFKENIR
jgi:hypothetical protein